MAPLKHLLRCWLAIASAVLMASGCGSSSSTTTAPTPVNRCGITLSTGAIAVPAQGGSGAVSVAATRECAWSASIEGGWLSIRTGASGQGEGTVEFAAAANPDPQARTGAVVVNGSRAQITQSAGECVITLASSSSDFPPAGGTTRVEVRSSSALCEWTASTDVPWIEITSGATGRGSALVSIVVAPTTGPPRAGSVTIAGQQFSVTQSQGCTYAIDRSSHATGSTGGSGTLTVVTAPACPWTAASNAEWITVTPSTGSGPAAVSFLVAPTAGPQRTGTAVIAGQLFTITQSPGCSFAVEPTSRSVGAGGGTTSVAVGTAAGCAWTAASNAPWITIQGPASGTGSGTLTFSAAATSGPARSGTLTVAGQQVTVTQTQGCTYALTPTSQTFGAAGGTFRVAVSSGAGCPWTAASNAPWITVTDAGTGSGNHDVFFSVAPTTGPARTGTLTIAGLTFTVQQGEGCTTALSPSSLTIDDDGGQRSFDVQTAAGCGWTAASSSPWIAITSGATGSGNGTVRFTVAANSGPGRSGSITAGGQTFTVTQGSGCSYSLASDRQDVPAAGGSGSVNVSAGGGCAWTATANAPWLTITTGANGSGNGSVAFTAAANSGPARSGTLTIGGRTFTVNQAEACTYAIDPSQHSAPPGGGTVDVAVTAPGGCGWTAASGVPWITVTSGATGSGNGTARLSVEPNTGAARTGTVTIAGRTFTVAQGSGCAFGISPTSHTAPAAGGTTSVSVATQSTCAWTASSNAPWLVVTSGAAGTGNGAVQMTVEPNTGAPRTGTATIAGQTFTVSQESGCSYTVAPETIAAPAGGNTTRVDVTTSAGCAWTAVSGAPWITVATGASGTGNGAVELTVGAHTGPQRTGTVTIAGRTVTVTQQSGCTIALTPSSQSMAAAGGPGSVAVAAAAGCGWTAVSAVPWITVTSGASGTGDGTVQFTVAANATAAPRSGTIAIGGQTFTVNQQQ